MLHAVERRTGCGFNFGLKTLDSDIDAAMDLWTDLVFGLDPHDKERLHHMQTRGVAWYRDFPGELRRSHRTGGRRTISVVHWLAASLVALAAHLLVDAPPDGRFEAHAAELMQGIDEVRDWLHDPARWTWSFTGSDEAFSRFEQPSRRVA
jgi:hypothetical protein